MDITTSIYYTYSTIAQVLAAFLALSGVFLIFKIQEIKNDLLFQANYFLKSVDFFKTIYEFNIDAQEHLENLEIQMNSNKVDELLSPIQGFLSSFTPFYYSGADRKTLIDNNEKLIKCRDRINVIQMKKRFIKRLTVTSMISGILMILISIWVLNNAAAMNENQKYYFFIVSFFIVIFSITNMFLAIVLSLYDIEILFKGKRRI